MGPTSTALALATVLGIVAMPACKAAAGKAGVVVAPHHNNTRCGDLDNLQNLTFWGDYGTTGTKFDDMGCPLPPGGPEFVPQLWGKGNLVHNDTNTTRLGRATFIMAFNEPDQYGQSWVHPAEAAELWPKFLSLARAFDLKVVAPCVSNADGASWWLESWAGNCTKQYGQMCPFDFACTHAYYFPGCPKDISEWACGQHFLPMVRKLQQRFNKPVWITEMACRSWGRPSGKDCTVEENVQFVQTFVPQLEASDDVHAYWWFETRDAGGNATDSLLMPDGPALSPVGEAYVAHIHTGGS